jgi:colicin import membrane protein
MAERNRDRVVSFAQSVLLHGAIVAALAYGWWTYRQHKVTPAPQTLAIEATTVDLGAAGKPRPQPPKPEPAPVPEPEPQPDAGPPTPSAEEIAQKEEQQHRLEEKKKAEEQREALQKQAQERATAERKEREAAEEKRAADEQRLTEQKRKAEDQKKAADARARAQREAELRQSLEEEERLTTMRSGSAMSSWVAQITGRIQRAWLRPPSARPGIDCVVYVTQVPGGEVVNVRVGSCNGDQSVRESIESAVYRASPLPPPPDPALFERNLEIRFKPVD